VTRALAKIAAAFLLLWPATGWPADIFTLESAGMRLGVPGGNNGSSGFVQAEAFANWNLPWKWDLGSDWSLQFRLEATAGWLYRSGDNSFVGSLGPTLSLHLPHSPISFVGGASLPF